MSLVSYPFTLVANTPEDITKVQANFDHLKTVINGGLDNSNLAAAAAIVATKLLPVRIATTVAGLGTAAGGAMGMLRLGSTPYVYLPVIYDATYGKWVSEPQFGIDAAREAVAFSGSGGITEALLFIPEYKAIHDAGMRLQVCQSGFLSTSDAASQARMGVNVYDYDDGDTALATLTTQFDQQGTNSTTGIVVARTFTQPFITPTQTHGMVAVGIVPQDSSKSAIAWRTTVGYRFVSA